MKIGLLDGNRNVKRYPFALLKLATYHKEIGNDVTFLGNKKPTEYFDEILISAIFTYDIPYVKQLADSCRMFTDKITIGGISPTLMPQEYDGHNLHIGQDDRIKYIKPDYSILLEPAKYSITQTSFGCIRKCEFCAVKTIDPEFEIRSNWEIDVNPNTNFLMVYDSNWTAKPFCEKERDIQKIKSMSFIKRIDFCQAIDCRIFTEEDAKLIGSIRVKPLRFAFDGMHEDGYIQNAIKLAVKYKTKFISVYMLYNFLDTPQDMYYRLREMAILQETLWPNNSGLVITVYPMMYQPVYDINSKHYIGKHYTKQIVKNIKTLTVMSGFGGGFTWLHGMMGSPIKNFELFMGSNPNEFTEIINSDNLNAIIGSKIEYGMKIKNSKNGAKQV